MTTTDRRTLAELDDAIEHHEATGAALRDLRARLAEQTEEPATALTAAQADGLACVHCGRDYLEHRGGAHVPLQRDGEHVRSSGSQLFVCQDTCEPRE